MTQEEELCIKELNDWYYNKSWLNIYKGKRGPFVYHNNKIHCFSGIMMKSVGLGYESISKKYTEFILEVMRPILNEHSIKEVNIGIHRYFVDIYTGEWVLLWRKCTN